MSYRRSFKFWRADPDPFEGADFSACCDFRLAVISEKSARKKPRPAVCSGFSTILSTGVENSGNRGHMGDKLISARLGSGHICVLFKEAQTLPQQAPIDTCSSCSIK
jgi:hypothetical protein